MAVLEDRAGIGADRIGANRDPSGRPRAPRAENTQDGNALPIETHEQSCGQHPNDRGGELGGGFRRLHRGFALPARDNGKELAASTPLSPIDGANARRLYTPIRPSRPEPISWRPSRGDWLNHAPSCHPLRRRASPRQTPWRLKSTHPHAGFPGIAAGAVPNRCRYVRERRTHPRRKSRRDPPRAQGGAGALKKREELDADIAGDQHRRVEAFPSASSGEPLSREHSRWGIGDRQGMGPEPRLPE